MSDIRTVTVTSCTPKKRRDGTTIQGDGTYGPWTLYEILATDQTGLPIQEEIACFKNLPLGEQSLEFTVKDDEKFGRSWTVKPLQGAKLPPPARTEADDTYEGLREQLRIHRERIVALEDAVTALGGFRAHMRTQTDVPAPPVQPAVQVAGGLPDDDVPFGPSRF